MEKKIIKEIKMTNNKPTDNSSEGGESDFPERVHIKASDLFNNHTRLPNNTFAAPMYVMVNPWDTFSWENEPQYIRADLFDKQQRHIDELEESCHMSQINYTRIKNANINFLRKSKELEAREKKLIECLELIIKQGGTDIIINDKMENCAKLCLKEINETTSSK